MTQEALLAARDALAVTLLDKQETEGIYSAAYDVWLAEMEPVRSRAQTLKDQAASLMREARQLIEDAVNAYGPDILTGVDGFTAAQVKGIDYDEAEVLEWAKQYAPVLVVMTPKLVPMTRLKEWLEKQEQVIDRETGEVTRVIQVDGEDVAVPIVETRRVQPRIMAKVLLGREDERRWNNQRKDEQAARAALQPKARQRPETGDDAEAED